MNYKLTFTILMTIVLWEGIKFYWKYWINYWKINGENKQ